MSMISKQVEELREVAHGLEVMGVDHLQQKTFRDAADTIEALSAKLAKVNLGQMVEVVRCEDCRWLKETNSHANCDGYLRCRRHGHTVDFGDYCSFGERGETE